MTLSEIKERIKQWSLIKRIALGALVFMVGGGLYDAFIYYRLQPYVPPEGYVYPSGPTISGIYNCCGNNFPHDAYSTVDGIKIDCEKAVLMSYTAASSRARADGDRMSACWLQDELNGKIVTVEQKIVPMTTNMLASLIEYFSPCLLVTEITSDEKIYFSRSDDDLRREWMRGYGLEFKVVFFLASFLSALAYYAWLIKKEDK